MRKLFLILLYFLPLLAFSQVNQMDDEGRRHGLWKREYPNGVLMYEGSFEQGQPVGEWKRYHEGGQLKAIIQYSESTDSAFTQLFSQVGNKIAEGNYVNEEKAGKWIYYADEQKIAEEHFVNGQKHGTSLKYYDSGELLESSEWVNGVQEGNYRAFYKTGEPYMQCKYSNNMRNGLCLTYFENGRIEMEAYYKNNLRNGDWNFYNDQGDHLYTLKYNEGRILNPEVRDSVDNMVMKNLENARNSVVDPEQFMQDPSEYMRKMNIY